MAGPVVGSPSTTVVGEVYLPLPKHRGQADQHRSIWTKPVPEEIACFVQAWQESWGTNGGELWGHVREGTRLQPLGLNRYGEHLWFGKFLHNPHPVQWHGYPADYRRKSQDRPPEKVLFKWRDIGILAKHQVYKIMAGKSCLP